mgnify:CR=1 FL=1
MLLEERDNNFLYITLCTYGIAITLTVISASLLLEVDGTAPYRILHFFKQISIAFLHFQMKVHLHSISASVARGFSYVDIETSLAVRKSDNILVANCWKCPSHASSIT